MRALTALAVAAILAGASVALAQVGQIGHGGNFFVNATSTYTGPGDVVAGATGWWGLRAFSNAKAAAGANLAIITRSSDSTTCTVSSDINGNLNLTGTPCAGSTIGSWCTSTTCSVTTLKDQVSTRDMVQATLSKAPVLTFNCVNTSLPCMASTRAAQTTLTVTGVTSAVPNSMSMVAIRTGSFTSQGVIAGTTGNGCEAGFSTTTNKMFLFSGGSVVTETANNSAWHAINVNCNGTTSGINVDGTDNDNVSVGTTSQNTGWSVTGQASGSNWIDGEMTEAGFWQGTGFTPTQRGNLCHNQFTYWATATSC